MSLTKSDTTRNTDYLKMFDKKEVKVQTIPSIAFYNEVIIIEKLQFCKSIFTSI